MNEPVFAFQDELEKSDIESYWPADYLEAALPILRGLNWLQLPYVTDAIIDMVHQVLDGISNLSLDEIDNYPFGLLWALRTTFLLKNDIDGLDQQLSDWRTWIQENYQFLDKDLDFLPELKV